MSPRFSVIVPTLNEAESLPATLRAAHEAFGAGAEYIVSDGGSTDDTCAVAHSAGARVLSGTRGRGVQLQRGLTAASGDVCILLHADTLVPAHAGRVIERELQPDDVAGGAFSVEFIGGAELPALLRGWQWVMNTRARLLRIATGDQVMFAKRSRLIEVGGVPPVPLFEDVRLCSALKQTGRFVIARDRVATSPRLWLATSAVRGIGLHLLLRALHALGASPATLARYYPAPR